MSIEKATKGGLGDELWSDRYTVGQSVDWFESVATGWIRCTVTDVWGGGLRVNPNGTSFGIAVTDKDRIKLPYAAM